MRSRRPRCRAARRRRTPRRRCVSCSSMVGDSIPRIWRDLIGFMRISEVSRVDLGFIAGGPKAANAWPSNAIAVGHSLGVLWLLHRAGEAGSTPFRGLVSIQGFDRFCPPIPPARVAGMRRGLRRDPGQTLEAFWRGCGTEPFAPLESLNVERLDEGLGWLMDWDARKARANLACPTTRPCRPRRCRRAGGDEQRHLGRGQYPLVAKWRPCATSETA